MNGLEEIRRLVAEHYFRDGVFVRRFHLVASVEQRPPLPAGDGAVWPPSYLLFVESQIEGRQWDFAELIDQEQFDSGMHPQIIDELWSGMRRALIGKEKELHDAVLSK